jgi:hypothetical protein
MFNLSAFFNLLVHLLGFATAVRVFFYMFGFFFD